MLDRASISREYLCKRNFYADPVLSGSLRTINIFDLYCYIQQIIKS